MGEVEEERQYYPADEAAERLKRTRADVEYRFEVGELTASVRLVEVELSCDVGGAEGPLWVDNFCTDNFYIKDYHRIRWDMEDRCDLMKAGVTLWLPYKGKRLFYEFASSYIARKSEVIVTTAAIRDFEKKLGTTPKAMPIVQTEQAGDEPAEPHGTQFGTDALRGASQILTAQRTAERDRFVDAIMAEIDTKVRKVFANRGTDRVINHIRFIKEADVPDVMFDKVKAKVAGQIRARYGDASFSSLSRAPKKKTVEDYFLPLK